MLDNNIIEKEEISYDESCIKDLLNKEDVLKHFEKHGVSKNLDFYKEYKNMIFKKAKEFEISVEKYIKILNDGESRKRFEYPLKYLASCEYLSLMEYELKYELDIMDGFKHKIIDL
jgi:hypothetical protein